MWQPLEILNIFNTLSFLKNWSTAFYLKVLTSKMQDFHSKLPRQNPAFRQIEWGVQNRPIAKNARKYFIFLEILFIKSLFDVQTIQMFIFILFVRAAVSFEGLFYLWVSLTSRNSSFAKGPVEKQNFTVCGSTTLISSSDISAVFALICSWRRSSFYCIETSQLIYSAN